MTRFILLGKGMNTMKKLIIILCIISSITCSSFVSFCFGMGSHMSETQKSKDLKLEKGKILIEHIGEVSKPIDPILIRCEDKNINEPVIWDWGLDADEIKQWPGFGYFVFLNRDEYKTVKKICESYSEADTGIREKMIKGFGIFYLTFYQDTEITNEFVINIENSRELFLELCELFKDDRDKHLVFLIVYNRIRPHGQPMYDPYNWLKKSEEEYEKEQMKERLKRMKQRGLLNENE